MEFGIDLGTTNSCIAQSVNDDIAVYQNLENMNVTPSAVYIDKRGRTLIGRKAKDKVAMEPENTALEFKRLMGVKHFYRFKSSGKDLSPVELSSEILKSLREDVYRYTSKQVTDAVITVPAAFGTLQCEATHQASVMAGFKNVVLLQEPIAAAVAYGAKPNAKDQYWMVFDFGGGTLDIAVVSTFNNRLTVINHEGDNYLGGKNVDEAIYQRIILPEIKNDFSLPEDPEEMEKIHRKLLIIAEDVKKSLSTMECVTADIYDVGEDTAGNPIEFRINIPREQFNDAISSIFSHCLNLAEKALNNANLPPEKLNKILLVGGSTLIPLIRQGLKEYFKVDVDCSIDPMTVVARGAAIYASTYEYEDIQNATIHKTDSFSNNDIKVKIECEPATSSGSCNVVGRFDCPDNLKIVQVKIDNSNGFWTSGWVDLIDMNLAVFDIDVIMQKNSINHFILSARNAEGSILPVADNVFSVKHSDEVLITSAPPIPHSLCVELTENGKRILEPVIKKGTSLPARAIKKLRANKTLRPGTDDFIAIKLWEGEEFTYPSANQWVGNIYIRSNEINRPIPEGSEIELDIAIDVSRKISVDVLVSHLSFIKNAKNVYNPEPLDLQEPMDLLGKEIEGLYAKLETMHEEQFLSDEVENEIYRLQHELHEIDLEYYECQKIIGIDDDRVRLLITKSERLKYKISELENRINSNSSNEVETETLNLTSNVVTDLGNESEKSEFANLRQLYHRSSEEIGNTGRETYIKRIDQLRWKILWNNYDAVKAWFFDLCQSDKIYVSPQKADYWKQQGFEADREHNFESLREAVIQLIYLQNKGAAQTLSEKNLPPDLRK